MYFIFLMAECPNNSLKTQDISKNDKKNIFCLLKCEKVYFFLTKSAIVFVTLNKTVAQWAGVGILRLFFLFHFAVQCGANAANVGVVRAILKFLAHALAFAVTRANNAHIFPFTVHFFDKSAFSVFFFWHVL